MTQFEQENDLGRGGGEVDEDPLSEAWAERERRLGREDHAAEESPNVDKDVERRS